MKSTVETETPPSYSLTVEVTEEDIRYGQRNNCRDCPIARAVRRSLKNYKLAVYELGISVSQEAIRITPITRYPSGIQLLYRTSSEARQFITSFDRGMPVQPTTFVFVPCEKPT